MKQILVSAVFSALAILLIPSQLRPDEPVPAVPEDTVLWIEDAGPETHWKETVSEPETAGLETVRLLDGGTVQLLPMDDYLTCVVLSEMPPEFESEALKAQAVAARTFYGKAPSLRKARKRRRLLRQRLLSGVAERGGAPGKIRRGF